MSGDPSRPEHVLEVEPSVRALVREVLAGAASALLDTGDAREALEAARSYPIRLLVADAVMPPRDGAELARRIESIRPGARVLFMSASALDDLLDPDARFIARPFALDGMVDAAPDGGGG